MPFQYSAEFRLRVCERLLEGDNVTSLANEFSVSVHTLYKWGSSDSGGVLTLLIGRLSTRELANWACQRRAGRVFGSSGSCENQSRFA